MYSSQSKGESQRVSKRVQQSKKEIEQLKLELQKLINRGVSVQESSANVGVNGHASEQESTNARAKYIVHRTPRLDNISISNVQPKPLQERKVEQSPKKVRHYNVDETREYMRKQKEKRSLMKKSQIKNSQINIDLKNQKLKELQMKSLQLVQKNVGRNRQRSKSRENALKIVPKKSMDDVDAKSTLNELKDFNVKGNETNCDNITIRNRDCDLDVIPILEPSVGFNSYDVECSAAVKIQALFRGYRQRKLYKLRLRTKSEDEAAKVPASVKKTVKELVADIEKYSEDQKPVKVKETVPFWLQPIVQPYPYNFITAVKRKLNIAVNSPIKISSDVGVQTPLNEDVFEVKSASKLDLKLPLSKICRIDDHTINCDSKKTIKKSKHSKSASQIRNLSSGSDTSKDIPDISSESSKCKSDSDIRNVPVNGLNVDKLKSLKLRDKSLENVCFNRPDKTKSKTFLQVPEINLVNPSKFRNYEDSIISCNSSDYSKSSPKSSLKSYKSECIEKRDIRIIASNISPLSKMSQIKLNSDDRNKSSHTVTTESARSNTVLSVDDDLRSKASDLFKSLLAKSPNSNKSAGVSEDQRMTDTRNSQQYTSSFSSVIFSATPSVPSLKRPSVTLKPRKYNLPAGETRISINPGEMTSFESKNTNQIHLKFEAELHLLNDFNQSLQQIMAIEKSLLELQSKNANSSTVYQHQDTQTSFYNVENVTKPESVHETEPITEVSKNITVRNYSRGSEVDDDIRMLSLDTMTEKSFLTTGLEMSQINESVNSSLNNSKFNTFLQNASFGGNVYAGLSLGMFDQLIKDEDTRIENLKTILKIREKALLDRTKGELMWLEIQKKHLIETGQLQEASVIKKKQRGILIKLQHEKQEMQRLKQMQKSSSKERKTILKEQRNTIKAQLSNSNVPTKIRRSRQKERLSGPMKVYNLHQESINMETSVLRKTSETDEIGTNETTDVESLNRSVVMRQIFSQKVETTKQTLLMRETALQKRRKAAEDLLQWHQRLLEEERKIVELEMAANSVINQVPSVAIDKPNKSSNKYTFTGSQLNSLWLNMTGSEERRFKAAETYLLSQVALERFCNVARVYAGKNKHYLVNFSDLNELIRSCISDVDSNNSKTVSKSSNSATIKECVEKSNDYTSEFELPEIEQAKVNRELKRKESAQANLLENEIDKSKSTLHEIMQNISNISDEISAIYKLSSVVCAKDENVEDQREYVNDISEVISEKSAQSEIVKSLSELIKSQSPCQDASLSSETPEHPNNRNNDSVESLHASFATTENKSTCYDNEKIPAQFQIEKNQEKDVVHESIIEEISVDKNSNLAVKEISNDDKTIRSDMSDFNDFNESNVNDDDLNLLNDNLVTSAIDSSNVNEFNHTEQKLFDRSDSVKSSIPTTERPNNNSLEINHKSIDDKSIKITETSQGYEEHDWNEINHKSIDGEFIEITETSQVSEELIDENDLKEFNYKSVDEKSIEITKTSQVDEELIEENDSKEINRKSIDEISIEIIKTSQVDEELIDESDSKEISHKSIDEKSIEITETSRADKQLIDENDLKDSIPNLSDDSSRRNVNCNIFDGVEHEWKTSIEKSDSVNEIETTSAIEIETNSALEIETNSALEIESNSAIVTERVTEIDRVEYVESFESVDIGEELENGSIIEEAKIVEIKDDKSKSFNVKKRVSEILADVSTLREDKSPRLQDIYTTTYDVSMQEQLAEIGSPDNHDAISVTQLYGEEAELFKKQLAIEQEIKQLELQQKEQIPYLYMREIPNKPPPPYTPPVTQVVNSILPLNSEQIDTIICDITDTIYESYKNGLLLSLSIQTDVNNIDKDCYIFIFDLCKELAIEHHKQLIGDDTPSWMRLTKSLLKIKPLNKCQLEDFLCKKTKEIIGFENTNNRKSNEAKWSRKKRDHVDELLVLESQAEESEWTNYDDDEVIVRNDVTNDIMNVLLAETADVMSKIFSKRVC